jgi:hypothetical protein
LFRASAFWGRGATPIVSRILAGNFSRTHASGRGCRACLAQSGHSHFNFVLWASGQVSVVLHMISSSSSFSLLISLRVVEIHFYFYFYFYISDLEIDNLR